MKNALFAVMFVLMAVFAIEIFGFFMVDLSGRSSCSQCWQLTKLEGNPFLENWHRANYSHDAVKTCRTEKVCYHVRYSFDEFGRRSVPGVSNGQNQTLILLGGSYAFGEGLKDQDTLQANLEDLGFTVHNYSLPGGGPGHILALFQSGKIVNEVKKRRAHALVVIFDAHIFRTGLSSKRVWNFNAPYYQWDHSSDSVAWRGTQSSAYPKLSQWYRFYREIEKNSFFFEYLNREFLAEDPQTLVQKTWAILKEAKDIFKKNFNGKFYIVFHPMKDSSLLKESGNGTGFDIIEFNDLEVDVENGQICECDPHPNGRVNQQFAKVLKKKISGKPTH